MLDRDPDSKRIFDAERHQRDDFDRLEQPSVVRAETRHRFEGNGREVEDDQGNNQAIDSDADGIAWVASFQNLIDTTPVITRPWTWAQHGNPRFALQLGRKRTPGLCARSTRAERRLDRLERSVGLGAVGASGLG